MASTACIPARLAVTVSVTALFLAASPAWAQSAPQSAGQSTAVEDVIVTAQKREQSLQDVPIAVSAFSEEMLEALQIDGGSELMRAVPNVTFSKSNFSMYNFSIRGVGTKAISASSDPAVAVSFNNTPLIRNRLFEQEYLDVDRVEVLRGPQGTLYGRNATAGVVNMIPNLPEPDFEAFAAVEAGNYESLRGQGMINVPITDTFWVRGAGSFTKRDGFDYNAYNDTHVNDRDLWSTRLSAAWEPNDRFSANLIWEHFEEDDQRSRTGKQLCSKDLGPTQVGSTTISDSFLRNRMSQGCSATSLFEDSAYGTPNAGSFSHVFITATMELGVPLGSPFGTPSLTAIDYRTDPYLGVTQSRDLREIATSYDPRFKAENDVVQLNMEYELSEGLTFYSQTAYSKDDYYSTQDYSRFVSNPIFADTSQPFQDFFGNPLPTSIGAAPGGVYTDPQLGPSSTFLSVDVSQSDNRQFTQEFRLQSDWDGMFNFSVGANYLDFKSEDNYYVFSNLFSYIAEYYYNQDLNSYPERATIPCDENAPAWRECVYVDYSPLSDLAGDGHNYFRSRNVVETRSLGVFGETYWQVAPDLRITAGLRYTDDRKTTTPYPSQLLLGASPDGTPGAASGGYVNRGYPALPDVKQNWDAVTGRLVVDWKPVLSFTDDTLVYASYSRGYKGGGTNPPRVDINPEVIQYQPLAAEFEPEYVNAFEVGMKNAMLDGRLRLNATAFYYDYKDYQVSQIVDRISLNENFDARIWGLEFEAAFNPTPAWRIDANLGYLNTRIADGEKSIDVMNRTQGNEDWTLLRPWIQVPSNCIAPTEHVETILGFPFDDATKVQALQALCAGSSRYGTYNPDFESILPLWQFFGFTYDALTEAPNFGRGFDADLSGNELPNSPNWTANIGTQYTVPAGMWDITLRADYYWQAESYFRVYNTAYDKLKSWDSTNISVTAERQDGMSLRLYVKNVFNDTPITDAFTNSDDTGLTTNVFTLDPRLIAVSISKKF